MASERVGCASPAWGNMLALMSKSSFGLQFQLLLLVLQGGSAAFCRLTILNSMQLCMGLVRGDYLHMYRAASSLVTDPLESKAPGLERKAGIGCLQERTMSSHIQRLV